jgi:hypothetical protein
MTQGNYRKENWAGRSCRKLHRLGPAGRIIKLKGCGQDVRGCADDRGAGAACPPVGLVLRATQP